SDTFYWRVVAEVDVVYYFPESWSPESDAWFFNVLKWPAAWIDNNYWECYTHDDSLEWIDSQTYLGLLSWGSPGLGWWAPVGDGVTPITVSPTARLSWSDRSTDEQQKNVTFADSYRIQLATSSSFSNLIATGTTENIFYVTPELSPGAYYWRVRSERNDGLVTEWNSPRKFIIAEAAPISTSISCSVSSSSLTIGGSVTLSGSIVPVCSGSTVDISHKSDGSWSRLATVTSGLDGVFSYSWTPPSPGSYQVMASWDGDRSYSGATSVGVPVTVTKISTFVACSVSPSEVNEGDSVTVSGSISPAVSGETVTYTYRKPDATTFTRTATTGSGGSFSDNYKPDATGSWSVKTSWEGDSTYKESTSETVSFTVVESEPEPEPEKTPRGIPGFPIRSVMIGILAGVLLLGLQRTVMKS
ncbi:MAG: Ig-like domain-containing protein, partial [Candidatus Bathyarchaeota archaeon]|nr:Ig-like domain-containing protein [Candidatus Bathyarchaeota archaeon]